MSRPVIANIVTAAFWAFLNALALRLLTLICMYLAARSLSSSDYGSVSLMMNTAQTWSLFFAGAASLTLAKYTSEYRANNQDRTSSLVATITTTVFFLALLISIFAAIFREYLVSHLFKNQLKASDILIVAFWLLILTHQSTLQGAITGLEKYRKNMVLAAIGGGASVLLILFGVPHERSWVLFSLVSGTVITSALMSWLVLSSIKQLKSKPSNYLDPAHFTTLIRFGLPAFVGGLIQSQSQWLANIGVATQSGNLDLIAGLNVTLQWYAIILFIPGAVSNSMLPVLSRLSETAKEQQTALNIGLAINIFISTCVAGTAYFLRHFILARYGDSYTTFSTEFSYLCLAAAIGGSSSMLMQQLMSQGKGSTALILNVVWSIFFLGWIFFTVGTKATPLSVSTAYAASNFVNAALLLFLVKRSTSTS